MDLRFGKCSKRNRRVNDPRQRERPALCSVRSWRCVDWSGIENRFHEPIVEVFELPLPPLIEGAEMRRAARQFKTPSLSRVASKNMVHPDDSLHALTFGP